MAAADWGASPRVRGRPGLIGQVLRYVRSIPARAGPTPTASVPGSTRREHPRACGADRPASRSMPRWYGASPRVRGRPEVRQEPGRPIRSIPARAGPTTRSPARPWPASEHPRACGADSHIAEFRAGAAGASPRVRGRPSTTRSATAPAGSIPARAGPTPSATWKRSSSGEHPRACGADPSVAGPNGPAGGASPRVRGRLLIRMGMELRWRSIPARAGPTLGQRPALHRGPEHPRACGADPLGERCSPKSSGASPRVRGRRRAGAAGDREQRSIPARAGPTGRCAQRSCHRGEHPRACGADRFGASADLAPCGASPRVRGRLGAGAAALVLLRSIPARAGPTYRKTRTVSSMWEHPRACGADTC